MRYITITPDSPLRRLSPLIQKTRYWGWKYNDRVGIRFLISGGKVKLMDAELNFPEGVGLAYSTPLFWNGPEAYETLTSRTLATLLAHSKAFLDVGSNIGIYSVYAGVRFPEVKTFAFEPIPAIWKKNRAFHHANRLDEEIVLNMAVGDQDRTRQIFIPVYTTGIEEEQTATLCTDSWQTKEERVEAIDVQCITLDTFAAKHPLPEGRCALKIDVENFEAGVFRGARNFMRTRRPWIVCEILPNQEIDPVTKVRTNNNQEVVALIEELEYLTYAITPDGYFRMTPADFVRPREIKDFLLLPKELVASDVCYLAMESLVKLLGGAV